MLLDIRTMVVVMLVSAGLMTVITWLGGAGEQGRPLRSWTMSLGCVTIGWALIALRGIAPLWVTVALADAFLIAGLCFQFAPLMELAGQHTSFRSLWIAPPALFLVLLPVLDQYAAYSSIATGSVGVAMFALSIACAQRALGKAGAAMGVCYFLASLLLIARTIEVAQSGVDSQDFDDGGLATLMFLALFGTTLIASFGFLELLRERAEAQMRRLATEDGLTGLLNHRALLQQFDREFTRARRNGSALSCVMLDVDHFKQVNDTYGHGAGDQVLVQVAATIRHAVREQDLVGRYGGEEFCVVLPDCTQQQAIVAAERIRQAVGELRLAAVGLTRVSISAGVTQARLFADESVERCIDRADQALYSAKAIGRNRVVQWRPSGSPGIERPVAVAAADPSQRAYLSESVPMLSRSVAMAG